MPAAVIVVAARPPTGCVWPLAARAQALAICSPLPADTQQAAWCSSTCCKHGPGARPWHSCSQTGALLQQLQAVVLPAPQHALLHQQPHQDLTFIAATPSKSSKMPQAWPAARQPSPQHGCASAAALHQAAVQCRPHRKAHRTGAVNAAGRHSPLLLLSRRSCCRRSPAAELPVPPCSHRGCSQRCQLASWPNTNCIGVCWIN